MKFRAVLAILFLACGVAKADPYELPQGFYLLSSSLTKPFQYSATSPDANWEITQSGALGTLPDFDHDGDQWTATDNQESVVVSNAVRDWTETIQQFGNGCNRGEFDSYIEPAPQAKKSGDTVLTQLSQMMVEGRVTETVATAGVAPPCASNHAAASYGVVLIDTAVTPNQKLFYSMKLAALCISGCKLSNTASWFWNGADHTTESHGVKIWNYGISDVPQSLGARSLRGPGAGMDYRFDFLPRIKTLIASEGNGIDTNLTHWQFAGDTRGNSVWGSVDFETTWQRWVMQF